MKIVLIKNRKMFHGDNPNSSHYYAMFWNKKYKKYNAIQLTHLTYRDEDRYEDVNKGFVLPIRLRKLDMHSDSGITSDNYISDINGNKLNPNMGKIVISKVSGSSSKKIKSFAKRLFGRGALLKHKKSRSQR